MIRWTAIGGMLNRLARGGPPSANDGTRSTPRGQYLAKITIKLGNIQLSQGSASTESGTLLMMRLRRPRFTFSVPTPGVRL
jgi:hypothetical protein